MLYVSAALFGCTLPSDNLPTVTPTLGTWHESEIAVFERADAEGMPEAGRVL